VSAIARARPDYGSGLANVYEWSAPGAATVRTPNAPYTTRMLLIFCRSDYDRSSISGICALISEISWRRECDSAWVCAPAEGCLFTPRSLVFCNFSALRITVL
jgi:hypothetical protein